MEDIYVYIDYFENQDKIIIFPQIKIDTNNCTYYSYYIFGGSKYEIIFTTEYLLFYYFIS